MLFNFLYFDPKKFGTPISFKNNEKLEGLTSDFMFNLVKKYFIKTYTKKPFFYFCGTHNVTDLESFMEYGKYNQLVKNQKIDFFFCEPLTHYLTTLAHDKQTQILKSNNSLDDRRNIRCYELDSISEWVEKHDIKHLTVFCTEYDSVKYYKKLYPNLKLKFMDVYTVAMFNHYVTSDYLTRQYNFEDKIYNSDNIVKKLIAPAWRYDPSRHFIMSFLAEKNLIKGNNVSFFYNIEKDDMMKLMWFNLSDFEHKHPEFTNILISGNEKLKNIVPISIDIKFPTAIYGPADLSQDGRNIKSSHKLPNAYRESFLAIVMESRVTQPWANISEKTISAIYNGRPFVIAGAPGVLKFLKDAGFKTFSDFWDESYDDIELHDDRLISLCNTIETICSMSLDQMKQMYNDMIPILKHNKDHIKNINQFYKNVN